MSSVSYVTLDSMPSLSDGYKNAFKDLLPVVGTTHSAKSAPSTGYVVRNIAVDPQNLNQYTAITGLPLTNSLPITYPFVLSFPLAMKLMTSEDYPFKAVGSVHIFNVIEQFKSLPADGTFTYKVHAENLRPHPKGQLIDVVVDVYDSEEGDLLWTQTSTYLNKNSNGSGKGSSPVQTISLDTTLPDIDHPTGYIVANNQIIQDYANISGDKNPIHTSKVAAKIFGFPSTIAHGMWSAATMLRQSIPKNSDNTPSEHQKYTVEFKLPVVLPTKMAYYDLPMNGDSSEGWAMSLRNSSKLEKIHALGKLEFLEA